jgi:hypothetical protein
MKMAINKQEEMLLAEDKVSQWKSVYKLGAVAALSVVLVGLLEIIITFLPGGNVPHETVLDWFALFQQNWFMGLRDLGLLNMFLDVLAVPLYLALYAAHRRDSRQSYAALALIISFLGVGVFFATNRAFPMLDLSNRYAAAATDAHRAMLEAVGQSMLSVGQSHTPGTFLGFALTEIAGITISIVMLRSGVFGRAAAYAGILGFSILLIFEFFSSFISGLSDVAMILAMLGGLLSMAWDLLVARRLFQLGSDPNEI